MTRTLLKTALIASGAALLIAAGPKADLNQDGQVTKAEFTESAQSRFFAMDTAGNNFLSEDERKAFKESERAAHKDARFEKLDANGDGLLSRDEMNAAGAERRAESQERRQKMLEKFDTNLDGTLSDAERTVMRSEFKDKMGERKGRRAERPKFDADGDGLISFEEHMAISEQLFTRMDANGDGVLTQGEGRHRKGKRGKKRGF